MKKYNFGEKEFEWSAKDNAEIPVWKSPKYEQAKKKVISMLESEEYKDVLDESDFWILMNRTKNGKMAYTGLIISHNGCLKINDTLPDELKFNPRCLNYYYKYNTDRDDNIRNYNDSLIFEYDSSKMAWSGNNEEDKQKIFEIGEVSPKNCTNDYPYAMALKRCMDRVILKNSKLAYSGVYSDSEAEEFANNYEESKENNVNVEENQQRKVDVLATKKQIQMIESLFSDRQNELISELKKYNQNYEKVSDLSIYEASDLIGKNKH